MICKRCFRLSDDGEAYCPYCGKSFTDDSEIEVKTEEAKDNDKNKNEKEDVVITDDIVKGMPLEDLMKNPTMPPPFIPPREAPSPTVEASPAKNLIRGIWHALLYFALFLLVQNAVATAFATVLAVDTTADYLTDYYLKENIDVDDLTDEEYEAMMNKLTEELNVIMMESIEDIDYNLLSAVASAVTVIVLMIIAKLKHRTFAEHTGFRLKPLSRPAVYAVIPAAIALQFIVIFILNIIPFSEETLKSYEELYSFIGESPLLIEIISVVIGAPLVEELIFRGCIQSRLKRGMSAIPAAILSSFIFGIAHGHIIAASYAFTLGLVLAYLYEKYDSVIVPILFHAAFNATNYLPILNENSTSGEVLAIVSVSLLVFAACAFIVIKDGAKDKTKESEKGI